MRLFVSVDLPEKLEDAFRDLQSDLRETGADLSLVDPEQAHITMKFLGDTDPDRLDEIERILDDATEGFSSFEATVEGTGVFPSRDFIKVVWAGVSKGSESLSEIHDGLETRFVESGFEPESHDFTPHITLARVQTGKAKSQINSFLDRTRRRSLGSFEVRSVRLKKSDLGPRGPVYETVYESNL
ncbi:MAG: RNA 2',3'-cyclic phosphodiesterase [Halobacteria archaeon]|nr:RNA 2',3'-cyclic phosphodiesterase [Halobacteria archaeon]